MPTEIVLWSFTSSNGNRQVSAIMLVRKKTRAQLFNLSPYSHAEQAWAGGEDVCVCGGGRARWGEKRKVSPVRSESLISPRARAQNRCKQTSSTRRNLDCWQRGWHNKPVRQNYVASRSCCHADVFSWAKHVSFHRFSCRRFSSSCPFFVEWKEI